MITVYDYSIMGNKNHNGKKASKQERNDNAVKRKSSLLALPSWTFPVLMSKARLVTTEEPLQILLSMSPTQHIPENPQ